MQLPGRHAGLTITVALVAAAVLTVTLLGRPASVALSDSTPAAGADVAVPPTQISLTFTSVVVEAHVLVSGVKGGSPPVIAGQTVTQPVTLTAAGSHVVTYHVVTRDGSNLAGSMLFTIGGLSSTPPPTPLLHDHDHGVDGLTATVLAVDGLVLLILGVLFLRSRGPRQPRTLSDQSHGAAR
jgi:methionine-rich copper-binding protein CopC